MKILLSIAALSGLALGLLSRTQPALERSDPSPISENPVSPIIVTEHPSTEDLSSRTLDKISLIAKIPTLTESQIEDLWSQGQSDYRIRRLILNRWIQLTPENAIASAKESGDEQTTWISWGKHDGQAALEYADQVSPDSRTLILKGIAFINPSHAIALIEANGGYDGTLAQPVVTSAIVTGLTDEGNYQEALNFYAAHHRQSIHLTPMIRWTEAKPEQALLWFSKNSKVLSDSNLGRSLALQVARKNPEALARVIQQIPTGNIKQQYLSAQKSAMTQ